MDEQLLHDWQRIRQTAGPYPPDAYAFVQEGLRFTVDSFKEHASRTPPDHRHVTGRELCNGLRDYALKEYGLLARDVLKHWRIRSTEDFGKIVFAMVEAGLLRKSDDDSIDDFIGVFSFDDSFQELQAAASIDAV